MKRATPLLAVAVILVVVSAAARYVWHVPATVVWLAIGVGFLLSAQAGVAASTPPPDPADEPLPPSWDVPDYPPPDLTPRDF